MNAKLPEGKLVIVAPPEQWVRWGLVKAGVLWTLERAVYGLRESPALWSAERDSQLVSLCWTVGKVKYHLRRCVSDSQLWILSEVDGREPNWKTHLHCIRLAGGKTFFSKPISDIAEPLDLIDENTDD